MRKMYHLTSTIFHPLLMPGFAMLWLMCVAPFSVLPLHYKILTVGSTLFFTGILPLVPIAVMRRKGLISNHEISRSGERTLPYLFSFFAYLLWWFFLVSAVHLPPFVSILGGSSAVAILLIMFINTKWKISAHLCSAGGVFAFVLGVSFHLALYPVALIEILMAMTGGLALARTGLQQHTPLQTLAGFSLGFLCTILPILLLNQ